MVMNKTLQVSVSCHFQVSRILADMGMGIAQEINIQNMNIELVAQMFKNYQSNVLFHLEGK